MEKKMDSNLLTPTPIPTPPLPTPAPVASTKSHLPLVLLGVLLVGIIVAAGVYFYTQKKNVEPPEASKVEPPPTSLESELDEVTLEDPSKDFIQIDQDISSL
ncbi:MAG: hypothetical protein Q7S88_00160 [Candidatus Daviesbacteria bacterium]|nr:hypothetical protein [Candidatus Daviesbacteria bacterium]